jgi:hypothetical protein
VHGLQEEMYVKWNENAVGGDVGAQAWANNGKFEHSDCYSLAPPAGPAGENLAIFSSGYEVDVAGPVNNWYSEVEDCDWSVGCQQPSTPNKMVGHFTALVWKSTLEIACAHNTNADVEAMGGAATLYVCRYLQSAPNFGGSADFIREVPQVQCTDCTEECTTKVSTWMNKGQWATCALEADSIPEVGITADVSATMMLEGYSSVGEFTEECQTAFKRALVAVFAPSISGLEASQIVLEMGGAIRRRLMRDASLAITWTIHHVESDAAVIANQVVQQLASEAAPFVSAFTEAMEEADGVSLPQGFSLEVQVSKTDNSNNTPTAALSPGMSGGAIAAIIVVVLAAMAALLGIGMYRYRSTWNQWIQQHRKQGGQDAAAMNGASEMTGLPLTAAGGVKGAAQGTVAESAM